VFGLLLTMATVEATQADTVSGGDKDQSYFNKMVGNETKQGRRAKGFFFVLPYKYYLKSNALYYLSVLSLFQIIHFPVSLILDNSLRIVHRTHTYVYMYETKDSWM
jgi:hypothetical protein